MVIEADGRTLRVIRAGLLGTKRLEWPREAISDIICLDAGPSDDPSPPKALYIVPVRGRDVTLFPGHSKVEIRWIAAVLRLAMRLSRPPAAGPQRPSQPGARPSRQ